MLAELGDRGLLRGAPLELDLDRLAVGDVVQHAVPAELAVLAAREHGIVADPDRSSVAVEHPVLERRIVVLGAVEAVLARQDPVAVLGVQALGPQLGVRAPLSGGVAEDLLDLGADVMPASLLAGVRDVDDRRHALEQLRVVRSGDSARLRSDQGRPRHHAGVAVADHVPC